MRHLTSLLFLVFALSETFAFKGYENNYQASLKTKSGLDLALRTIEPNQKLTADFKESVTAEFKKSFDQAYQGISIETLGLTGKFESIDAFLDYAAHDDFAEFEKGERYIIYLTAPDNPKRVIAYASFFYDEAQKDLHVTQLFIATDFQRQGLATQILDHAKSIFKDAKNLSLETRNINKVAQAFFSKKCFEKKGSPRDPYNPKYYDGYKKDLA